MHIAEDLVLKQALVKFCTHLELASAFMHKVVGVGSVPCSNCNVFLSVAAAYLHASFLHAPLFMMFYAKTIPLTGSAVAGIASIVLALGQLIRGLRHARTATLKHLLLPQENSTPRTLVG